MYIIIPASAKTEKNTLKTLECVSGLPILQHILNELYSYQEHVDKIIIPTQDVDTINEYIDYSITDAFLRTKIHVIKGNSSTVEGNMYASIEHLVDCLHVKQGDVLVWSGTTLLKNSFKLTDLSEGSFVVTEKKKPIGIFRFDDIRYLVNILVKFSYDNIDNSMQDILRDYYQNDTIKVLEVEKTNMRFYPWQTAEGYLDAEKDFNENNPHSKCIITIDPEKQTLSKHNKYSDMPYSYDTHQKSKKVQAILFGEQDFLSKSDKEQAVYLPSLVSTGVTLAGEYLDDITEEWIPYQKLDSFLISNTLPKSEWKYILTKICKVLSEFFHKDGLEYEEMQDSIVPRKIRERRISAFEERAMGTLEALKMKFSGNCYEDFYYKLSNNDYAEWKMFMERLIENMKKFTTQDNTLYQGVKERRVHGSLSFDCIAYDEKTRNMKFLNPEYKSMSIMNTIQDYASLYTSCFLGVPALVRGKYKEENSSLTIQQSIQETMDFCTEHLDDILGSEISEYAKMLAIYMTLEKIAYDSNESAMTAISILKFLNQLRVTLYWEKMRG